MVWDDAGGDLGSERALLFGGSSEQGLARDLWSFWAPKDLWSEVTPSGEAPAARAGHDAAWAGAAQGMFVFGGFDESSELNDLWVLAPA